MADEEKSKDGKGQGGCCGCCIGCLVVIALLIAFALGFYVVPTLRDNNWDWEVFPQKVRSFRTRLGNKIDDFNYRFVKLKENVEDAVEDAEDKLEDAADKLKKSGKKAVKKTEKMVEPLVDGDLKDNLIED